MSTPLRGPEHEKPVYRPKLRAILFAAWLWLIIIGSVYGIWWLWNG